MGRFEKISLEKYTWSIGTTSFRVENLRGLIPQQLDLLNELNGRYPDLEWNTQKQELYSKLLTERGIFNIEKTLDKDARVKTSSLAELGLTTEKREITEIGNSLLDSYKKETLDNTSNIFQISNDSFIYLKQLLKYQTYSEFKIKPFLVLLYFCTELENGLSLDYFTYLLPICSTKEETKWILNQIRENEPYIDIILNKIINSSNTQKVKEVTEEFQNLTDEEILSLFPHGKGSSYVTPILELHKQLSNYRNLISLEEKYNLIENLNFDALKKKSLTQIKEILFGTSIFNSGTDKQEVIGNFENTGLIKNPNLIYELYILYTLSSYLANLLEYKDLNLRYFKLTDIFIIGDEKIELDILPKAYFSKVSDSLLEVELWSEEEYRRKLENNIPFEKIYSFLDFNSEEIKYELMAKYPNLTFYNFDTQIKKILLDEKERQFRKLIEDKFTSENIIKILTEIKEGKSSFIKKIGFDTTIPTILEYIVGVAWFRISNQEGELYNIFNLKLDSNCYPVRFASGGQADLIYKYSDGHHLLLEVTMSEKDSQRKLELEPVPRHLGRYRLDGNDNSYTIFIAPYLDPNVLVSFRAMKYLPYYHPHNFTKVQGLKIIPLSIDNLIYILEENISYNRLKCEFEQFYLNNEIDGFLWYNNNINKTYLKKKKINL